MKLGAADDEHSFFNFYLALAHKVEYVSCRMSSPLLRILRRLKLQTQHITAHLWVLKSYFWINKIPFQSRSSQSLHQDVFITARPDPASLHRPYVAIWLIPNGSSHAKITITIKWDWSIRPPPFHFSVGSLQTAILSACRFKSPAGQASRAQSNRRKQMSTEEKATTPRNWKSIDQWNCEARTSSVCGDQSQRRGLALEKYNLRSRTMRRSTDQLPACHDKRPSCSKYYRSFPMPITHILGQYILREFERRS